MQHAKTHTPSLLSAPGKGTQRSEEHTSELQSHLNLVCRLLLEKKNTNSTPSTYGTALLPASSRILRRSSAAPKTTSVETTNLEMRTGWTLVPHVLMPWADGRAG